MNRALVAFVQRHWSHGVSIDMETWPTLAEAREAAEDDFGRRMGELEAGGAPLCPDRYDVWARDGEGTYRARYEQIVRGVAFRLIER